MDKDSLLGDGTASISAWTGQRLACTASSSKKDVGVKAKSLLLWTSRGQAGSEKGKGAN